MTLANSGFDATPGSGGSAATMAMQAAGGKEHHCLVPASFYGNIHGTRDEYIVTKYRNTSNFDGVGLIMNESGSGKTVVITYWGLRATGSASGASGSTALQDLFLQVFTAVTQYRGNNQTSDEAYGGAAETDVSVQAASNGGTIVSKVDPSSPNLPSTIKVNDNTYFSATNVQNILSIGLPYDPIGNAYNAMSGFLMNTISVLPRFGDQSMFLVLPPGRGVTLRSDSGGTNALGSEINFFVE